MTGIGLYGLTCVHPIFLARVRGYDSLQVGETMFVSGLCMSVATPVVGKLMRRVDPRLPIALGFTGLALGTWMASAVTKDWGFGEPLVLQMLRGFSLMTAMVPINNVALGTLPPARLKNASGLCNLTRNLGDVFPALTVLFVALAAVTPPMSRPGKPGGGGGAH